MTVVDEQKDAYNNQDIQKFLSCYTEDIQVYMLEQGKMITEGKEQLRAAMTSAFEATPDSRTMLISRMEQNNLIVDHEKITGHETGKAIYTIAIYEITNNKISKLWFGGRSIEEL